MGAVQMPVGSKSGCPTTDCSYVHGRARHRLALQAAAAFIGCFSIVPQVSAKVDRTMKRALTIAFVASSVAVAGCGSGTTHRRRWRDAQCAPFRGRGAGSSRLAAATAFVTVRAAHGYGRLLVDGQGRTLYLFTRDAVSGSRCSGACARAWPPFVVSSAPAARAGVEAPALGVTRRSDGPLQASYHGRPLHYFAGDAHPGEINCQDAQELGGHWWLVAPSGEPNRASP